MDDLDKLARRRANRKLRFYVHAGIFAVVNTTLYLAGAQETPLRTWHAWPFIGWSVHEPSLIVTRTIPSRRGTVLSVLFVQLTFMIPFGSFGLVSSVILIT